VLVHGLASDHPSLANLSPKVDDELATPSGAIVVEVRCVVGGVMRVDLGQPGSGDEPAEEVVPAEVGLSVVGVWQR